MRMVRGGDDHDVQLEGLVVRVDRPGMPSQLTRHAAYDEAVTAHAAAIAERLAQGFVEAIDPALDDEARLVHADELQQRGDPVGELIAAQAEAIRLRRHSDPRMRARVQTRITGLFDANHDAWFGDLSRHTRKPSRKSPAVPVLDVRWRLGFAEVVRLRGTDLPISEVYTRLRALTLSRYIRTLTLGPIETSRLPSYAATFQAMLDHGIPSRLRELEVGDDELHRRPELDLDGLAAVISIIPMLDTLRITGGHGALDLGSETLRRMIMHGVRHFDLDRLHEARLPALEALELWGHDRLTIPAWLGDLPVLRHLTLAGFDVYRLVPGLARIAPRLATLALPRCGLDDISIRPLVDDPGPFAQLKRLDLRDNHVSPGMETTIRRRIPTARFR